MKLALALVTASMWVLLLPSAVTAQTKQAEVTTDLLVPDTIKPSGAHGTVVLEGDIGPDGHVANLMVGKSSRSEEIDQFALKRYEHAGVGDDLKEGGASRIQLTVRVYNTRGMDFGAGYNCQQAILDNDWYKRTFETTENEHTQLYLLIEAEGNFQPKLAFAKEPARYDRAWSGAIEVCRKTPEANWLATLIQVGRDAK
jgi:TonB family protein